MDNSSSFTASTVFHGTDIADWKEKVMSTLRFQGLAGYVEGTPHDHQQDPQDSESREQSFRAATFISMLVNPAIMQRVPLSERSNPRLLMQCLESLSTPFRLLDLPLEVRNRVYRFVLSDHRSFILRPSWQRKQHMGYPAITKVSRQIRDEVLPIFYSSTSFVLIKTESEGPIANRVRSWMNSVVRSNAKHLHRVAIQIPIRDNRLVTIPTVEQIEFTFTQQDGLSVSYPDGLTHDSRKRLHSILAITKSTAAALETPADNRLILLALITQGDLWREGNLKLAIRNG